MLATGLVLSVLAVGGDLRSSIVFAVESWITLFILTRVGLLAVVGFWLGTALSGAPPLVFSEWYATRALIALLAPLAVLVYGFYVSLGGQPMFGKALDN